MVSYVLLEMYINKTLSFQNNEQKHFVSCVKPFKPLPKEGRWCSLGTPVSSTNKTDHHDQSTKHYTENQRSSTMNLNKQSGVNSDAPEGLAILAPLVAPIMLL
jgi:hypothetical protein